MTYGILYAPVRRPQGSDPDMHIPPIFVTALLALFAWMVFSSLLFLGWDLLSYL